MNRIESIKNEIIHSAEKVYKDKLWKIMIFGSYARGDYNEESDIDIMILLDCNDSELHKYRKDTSHMASAIGLSNDIEVSLLVRDRKNFEERQRILPFYRNVANEGVTIYG